MPSASDEPARADVCATDAPSSERMSSESSASEPVPSEVALPGPQGALTERDRRILALEGRTFRYVGAKERAIREEIGLSKVAYYVRLNALLDEPAALRAAPAVVNRLRARRTSEDGGASLDGDHRVA
ncbi:DUF3263 domain-containing protein [Brachybacterium paraconglomeratum]|uniref:DUF3263 domain-containing protein n=1 Tax=Brachybacterium paraconglomeratum TaxID=173362 RepID=UPI00387A7B3B